MNKRRVVIAAFASMVLASMLVVLSACSCSQTVESKSEEKLEANEVAVQEGTGETAPFYVLVVGEDTRKGTVEENASSYADGSSRSDTMMLVRVDPTTYQITLVTVPRDTKDEVLGTTLKINEHLKYEGIEGCMTAVENLTGAHPKYYITTTFVGFEDLVNKLEGVDIDVPFDQSMTDIVSGEEIAYPAGEQTLDGAEALVYARERHKYDAMGLPNQEAYRQAADRSILQALITKVLSNAGTAQAVTELLYPSVTTNWDLEDLKVTVQDFADNADKVSFVKGSGPYDGDIDSETQVWMAFRDEATWREVIAVVDAGGDPNSVVDAPSTL